PAHGLRKPDAFAFSRHRHLVDRRSGESTGARLGGALSGHAAGAGGSARRLEHDVAAAHVLVGRTAVPSIASPAGYSFASPNSGAEAVAERNAALRIASHVPVERPELAFVYGTAQEALATLDRVATVAQYTPSLTYPNTGLGLALRAVAGAMV